jgi:hypothetical protein
MCGRQPTRARSKPLPNYLCVAGGNIGGAFPWSVRSYAVATNTEAQVESTWDAAFIALWNTAAWNALMPTTTTLTYTSVATLGGGGHQQTKTQIAHNLAGTSTGNVLPMQVCVIATFRTALANKAGRGRWYLPAPSASALNTTGGIWAPATMTALASALNAFGTALGSSVPLQIYHRLATKSGPFAGTFTPIIQPCDASNKPGIQRRRGDKYTPIRTSWNE